MPPTWSINRAVIPAALLALCIGIFFSYVPALYVLELLVPSGVGANGACSHSVFQTHDIPVEYFFLPMTFGLGLLMCVPYLILPSRVLTCIRSLDEVRKLANRRHPHGFMAWLAW